MCSSLTRFIDCVDNGADSFIHRREHSSIKCVSRLLSEQTFRGTCLVPGEARGTALNVRIG